MTLTKQQAEQALKGLIDEKEFMSEERMNRSMILMGGDSALEVYDGLREQVETIDGTNKYLAKEIDRLKSENENLKSREWLIFDMARECADSCSEFEFKYSSLSKVLEILDREQIP